MTDDAPPLEALNPRRLAAVPLWRITEDPQQRQSETNSAADRKQHSISKLAHILMDISGCSKQKSSDAVGCCDAPPTHTLPAPPPPSVVPLRPGGRDVLKTL